MPPRGVRGGAGRGRGRGGGGGITGHKRAKTDSSSSSSAASTEPSDNPDTSPSAGAKQHLPLPFEAVCDLASECGWVLLAHDRAQCMASFTRLPYSQPHQQQPQQARGRGRGTTRGQRGGRARGGGKRTMTSTDDAEGGAGAVLGAGGSRERVNVYYSTGTVATALDHPVKGKTQLFRRGQRLADLERIFKDPRVHTGVGYYTRAELAKLEDNVLGTTATALTRCVIDLDGRVRRELNRNGAGTKADRAAIDALKRERKQLKAEIDVCRAEKLTRMGSGHDSPSSSVLTAELFAPLNTVASVRAARGLFVNNLPSAKECQRVLVSDLGFHEAEVGRVSDTFGVGLTSPNGETEEQGISSDPSFGSWAHGLGLGAVFQTIRASLEASGTMPLPALTGNFAKTGSNRVVFVVKGKRSTQFLIALKALDKLCRPGGSCEKYAPLSVCVRPTSPVQKEVLLEYFTPVRSFPRSVRQRCLALNRAWMFLRALRSSGPDMMSTFRSAHATLADDLLLHPDHIGQVRTPHVPTFGRGRVVVKGGDMVPPDQRAVSRSLAMCFEHIRERNVRATMGTLTSAEAMGNFRAFFLMSVWKFLIAVHPFYDGNGRTIRSFLAALLVHELGLTLNVLPAAVVVVEDNRKTLLRDVNKLFDSAGYQTFFDANMFDTPVPMSFSMQKGFMPSVTSSVTTLRAKIMDLACRVIGRKADLQQLGSVLPEELLNHFSGDIEHSLEQTSDNNVVHVLVGDPGHLSPILENMNILLEPSAAGTKCTLCKRNNMKQGCASQMCKTCCAKGRKECRVHPALDGSTTSEIYDERTSSTTDSDADSTTTSDATGEYYNAAAHQGMYGAGDTGSSTEEEYMCQGQNCGNKAKQSCPFIMCGRCCGCDMHG